MTIIGALKTKSFQVLFCDSRFFYYNNEVLKFETEPKIFINILKKTSFTYTGFCFKEILQNFYNGLPFDEVLYNFFNTIKIEKNLWSDYLYLEEDKIYLYTIRNLEIKKYIINKYIVSGSGSYISYSYLRNNYNVDMNYNDAFNLAYNIIKISSKNKYVDNKMQILYKNNAKMITTQDLISDYFIDQVTCKVAKKNLKIINRISNN